MSKKIVSRAIARGLTASLFVLSSGCAGSNILVRSGAQPPPQRWTMELCPESKVGVAGHLVRTQDGSGWRYEPGEAPPGTPGMENIRVRAKERTVCLSAPYPKAATCPVGLFGNVIKQSDDETSLCASELTSSTASEITVIAFPLSAFLLTVLLYPTPGSSMREAVSASNAIYLSYQQEFREAGMDARALRAFVANHASDDPDHLAPIALQRIQRAEQEEAAARAEEARDFEAALERLDAQTDPALASTATARDSVSFLREMIDAKFAADNPCMLLNRRRGSRLEPLDLARIPVSGRTTVRTRRLYGYEGSDMGLVHDLQVDESDFVRVAQSSDIPADSPGDPPLKSKNMDDARRVSAALYSLALRCGARIDTRFR